MQKGMSLAVETTVVIVIAIIVLVALLMFFGGSWGQGVDRIRLEQQKVDLCSKYVAYDTECKGTSLGTAIEKNDFEKMCKGLGLPTNPQVCCAVYCPKQAECGSNPEPGYNYYCAGNAALCSGSRSETVVSGVCDKPEKVCCRWK